jgi:phosphatidate cytidylyltransferase
MLKWRLILGTQFIAGLAGLCWLDYHAPRPGTYLLPLAIVLSLLAAGELLAMFQQRGHKPLSWVIYGGVLLTMLSCGMTVFLPNWAPSESVGRLGCLMAGLATAFFLAIIGELSRYRSPFEQPLNECDTSKQAATTNLALSMLAVFYAGGLMGFLVQLRLLDGPRFGNDGRWGMVALISLVATVKMSDIGQYTVGRLIGRRKLAPSVSPGKTWEGALGGAVFGVFAAWLVFYWGADSMTPGGVGGTTAWVVGSQMFSTVGFAIAVTATGIIGDLAESMFKRDAGLKDSSTWMPGFGGVLDLLDSLLGAAPVAYLFWAIGIVGP